jgi:hypothetical protein
MGQKIVMMILRGLFNYLYMHSGRSLTCVKFIVVTGQEICMHFTESRTTLGPIWRPTQ